MHPLTAGTPELHVRDRTIQEMTASDGVYHPASRPTFAPGTRSALRAGNLNAAL